MDIADLVVRVLSAIAWPGVVLAGLIMFRRPLTGLIGEAQEISGFGASIKRGDAAAHRVLELAKEIPVSDSSPTTPVYVPFDPHALDPADRVEHYAENPNHTASFYETAIAAIKVIHERDPSATFATSGSAARQVLADMGAPIELQETYEAIVDIYTQFDRDFKIPLSGQGLADFYSACLRFIRGFREWSASA